MIQKENAIGECDTEVIVKDIDHLEVSLAEYDRFNFWTLFINQFGN